MKFKILILFIFLFKLTFLYCQQNYDTSKPWTYWWWMGNAVNKTDIKKQLEDFSESGLGGVHIIPIYGAKGYEEQFLQFLSEEWLEMVQFTIKEANALHMGVDITLGTGWPFGGKWISDEFSAKKLSIKEFTLENTNNIRFNIDSIKANHDLLELLAIYASDNNKRLNLTSELRDGIIDYTVPQSNWRITVFGISQTRQTVKRAAPGGEGLVLDYFNGNSINRYLHHFDSIFLNTKFKIQPRAYYHDSYEVYDANWASGFSGEFRKLQGYDLIEHLPILLDTMNDHYPLIQHDIRETLSELIYTEFTSTWTDWCKNHNYLSRNQAHGSPGNILDLYALTSIPETESFGCSQFAIPGLRCDPDYEEERFGRPSPLMMKFASSPAHLLEKPLVSSETGTWLANHFKVSLKNVKPQIDELFVSGINHIFYHGITYSPEEEGYPGWLFYASTNFGPTSHFWDEMPLLNNYIRNCQKLLQGSKTDNNILVYFPINDLWLKSSEQLLLQIGVHHYESWFSATPFGEVSELIWNNGFAFDYISDKQISQLKIGDRKNLSITGKSTYQTIIIPSADLMPEKTLNKLDLLAKDGAKIIFVGNLPHQYPEFLDAKLKEDKIEIVRKRLLENKNVLVSKDLVEDLKKLGIRNEEIKIKGLDFIRKTNSSGTLYFLSNLHNNYYEDSISLSADYNCLQISDPQTGKSGYIYTSNKFKLKVPPGKSYFIQTLISNPQEKPWKNYDGYDTIPLSNDWRVSFIKGNNQSPQSEYVIDSLYSWTEWGSESLKTYMGKAIYVSNFKIDLSDKEVQRYTIFIKNVRETAEVIINGEPCGTIWAYPYELEISPRILKEENQIEIIVQNLSSNYMKLYDSKNPEWKKFYDINFVDITYTPFNTARWDYEPSGLIGKVVIVKEK